MGVDNAKSQDSESTYAAMHEFSNGLSSQWRNSTVYPLAFYEEQGESVFNTQPPTSHDYFHGEFADPDFFQYVDKGLFMHKAPVLNWSYEMRRKAQQILPFLYLGPYSCIKDRSFLKENGITLLLGVRAKASASANLFSGEGIATSMGIEADSFETTNNQELITAFPSAIRRINQHLAAGFRDGSSFFQRTVTSPDGKQVVTNKHNKILVYCESGNERSACVVSAYLMTMLNVSMEIAWWTVQHRRFSTHLGEQMRDILNAYEAILAAKRAVVGANQNTLQISGSQSNNQNPISRKRSFDDRMQQDHIAYNDHNEQDGLWDGADQFAGRHQEAPFYDK